MPAPPLPPLPVSYAGCQEVLLKSDMHCQESSSHVAALEEIVALLLQQHERVVKSFQDSLSGHSNVVQRWNQCQRARARAIKQGQQPLRNINELGRVQELIALPEAPTEPEAPEAPQDLEMPESARTEEIKRSLLRCGVEIEASPSKSTLSSPFSDVELTGTPDKSVHSLRTELKGSPGKSAQSSCFTGVELKGSPNKSVESSWYSSMELKENPDKSGQSLWCSGMQLKGSPDKSVQNSLNSGTTSKGNSDQMRLDLTQQLQPQGKDTAKSYPLSSNPPSSLKEDVATWSKQLELEELREMQAAKALCDSSQGTKTEEPLQPGCGWMLYRFVHGPIFETVVTIAIITNAILIGVETQYMAIHKSDQTPSVFKILGLVYVTIFFVELSLRLTCEGMLFFRSLQWPWNLFDMFCVACSLFEILVDALHEGAGPQNTNIVRVVRIVRTLRLSRTIRIGSILRLVSALQILVQSIVATLKSLIWALVLMCMIVYICGIMFTQAVTSHLIEMERDQDYPNLLEYWGNIGTSMSTLYQSVTGGVSWREASSPLGSIGWIWEFLFVAYVSFTYFAVLNVVTGVFCNSAIENARHEPELVIKNLLSDQEWYEKNLKELFNSLDRDNSGRLSIRELEKSIDNPSVRAWFGAMGLEISDAWTLFKLIDEDRSYDVSSSEFVTRCMQLRGNARSIDLALLRKEHSVMVKKMLQMADRIEKHFSTSRADMRLLGQKSSASLKCAEAEEIVL